MMTMNKKEEVIAYLNELFPNAGCELNYSNDYELLIAIILSAQCTDKRVNMVTKEMFSKYHTIYDIYNTPLEEIESDIKSVGLYKNKSKAIKEAIKIIVEQYNGIVPHDKKTLISLPGVGNKTANVFRAEYLKEPEIAVDTHVSRVAKRLGFAAQKDQVETIERKLRKAFDKSEYIKVHHLFIHFGRYFCKAINPNCKECVLKDICRFYNIKNRGKR